MNFTKSIVDTAMRKCYGYALNSPDPSTQNAAVIIDESEIYFETLACNQFPYGVKYLDDRWERPQKYSYIEHAERNAIYLAARHGLATDGKSMVCPWAACAECARAIIQSGIEKLYTLSTSMENTGQSWLDSIQIAEQMFKEAGIAVIYHDVYYGDLYPIKRNGVWYNP